MSQPLSPKGPNSPKPIPPNKPSPQPPKPSVPPKPSTDRRIGFGDKKGGPGTSNTGAKK